MAGGAAAPLDATIWTLDARDSMLLEVMSVTLGLTDVQVRATILGALRELQDVLASKGLDYRQLRNPLVPQQYRREIAFLFLADQGGYGSQEGSAADSILRLLPRALSCSLLTGDLIIRNQDVGFALLEAHHVGHKAVELVDTSQIYTVYVNNLSNAMVEGLTESLKEVRSYVGYVDCTFGSQMKDWVASTLPSAYLKVGETFIGGHEDDVPHDQDYDLHGWPLERYGYTCRSVQLSYFDLFLGYKIERRSLPQESDTKFGLSAISSLPVPLADLEILVDNDKMEYLRRNKLGILASTGLEEATPERLQHEIRQRIDLSYIYELQYTTAHDTSQFNVMLEMASTKTGGVRRVKAVLAYEPGKERLRLVTLY